MPVIVSAPPTKLTESGLVISGKGIFRGFLLGTDGVNDPTITVFDGTDASGPEIVPTCTYDASALGLNGATGMNVLFENGLYIDISCAGSVEVVPEYVPYESRLMLKYDR